MWNNFGVDYQSIKPELRGFDWSESDDIAYVDSLVREHSAAVYMQLIHIGRTEDAERPYSQEDPLHVLCHSIVKHRVMASVIRAITHQDSDLAEKRDARADELMRFLERKAESVKKQFVPSKNRGVFGGHMAKGTDWDKEF